MKILTIHVDFIEFQAKKKAFKGAEEGVSEDKKRVEECLVIFTSVEKRDESNTAVVIEKYIKNIEDIAGQVKATKIVLYPYAHLSSQLAAPVVAEGLMKDAERKLAEKKYSVVRAPFGWYKSFTIACKGHPLSELSREFSCDEGSEGAKAKGGAGGGGAVAQGGSGATTVSETAGLKREYKDESFVFLVRKMSAYEKKNLYGAFVLAVALKQLYPHAEIGSFGLHQDQAYCDVLNVKLHLDNFRKIEEQMRKIIAKKGAFIVSDEKPTAKLQQEIGKDARGEARVYELEGVGLFSLYKEPFVKSVKEIEAFKLLNLSSAYWKNNSNNAQLTRITLVAFPNAHELDDFIKKQQDAENRSHLKIGKEQGLFVVSELVGQGLPLLAPKGTIIKNEIIKFLWELHKDKGYQQVWTPHIAKDLLYKTSGHWDKFGDELFKVKGKSDDFIMKPMNCPHHMQIFDSFAFSYRDMPVRYFEPATIYRDEKSGQLLGLSRVRAITQDDGHLFCRLSQVTQEVMTIVSIVHEFYRVLEMDTDYWVSFSVRGDDKSKYLGTDEMWKTAEEALEKAAQKMKLPYKRREGEAAFYGPKLDFMFKDALGREWQLATIQCDFNLPQRFNLSFMNEKSEKERPVVIHRAISGSLERFMSILIEQYAGKFPLWLSPVQVKLVTVTDRNIGFATEVMKKLRAVDVRVELNDFAETIGKKVRDAQQEKVNYIVTIGDKECEKKTLAVRSRAGEVEFDVPVERFVAAVVEEMKMRKVK